MAAETVTTRLIARVRALRPNEWLGRAGRRFRAGTQAISQFAEQNCLLPEDVIQEAVDLSRRKITGLASQEDAAAEKSYAEAARAFTETEDKKIDIEQKRRSLEAEVSRRQGEARKVNAEADLAEIHVLEAKLRLYRDLSENGIALSTDGKGNLIVLLEEKVTSLLGQTESRSAQHSA